MTIGAMARRTGLTESTLRYYEKKGLIHVARDGGGRRDYDEGDVAWIAFLCRLKETGMLLRDIRRYAEDTDYVLVRETALSTALRALTDAGYSVG